MTAAYKEGLKARKNGKLRSENKYNKSRDPQKWGDWDLGWKDDESIGELKTFDVRSDKSSLRQCDCD